MTPASNRPLPDRLRAAGSRLRALLASGPATFRRDLREDPYLRYVLLLAVVLCSFWFWHRIPNFATRDEKSRLLDSMVAYAHVIEEPSFESLQEGVTWGRVPFGATFYLFGLAVLPVVILAWLTGDLAAVASLTWPDWEFGYYPAWQALPEWMWTISLGLVRLFNVAFAVGAVYVTYRLGRVVYGRLTGSLAALLLTLSFGFLTIAHEGGEDMPALFFVLLALYLAYRFVETGDGVRFLLASAAGGVALAFKLTAAPVVMVIGVAFLLRVQRTDGPLRARLFRPKLVLGGALTGLLFIALGFPTLLVGSIDVVADRLFANPVSRATHATGPDAPIWWWFLRGYFSGLSLPLFFAGLAGVVAAGVSLAHRKTAIDGTVLVFVTFLAYVLVFSQWHDFRVHHLLPTFPLIALLLADRLEAFRDHWPSIGRVVLALLLVSSGVYAVVGTAGYASMPRDQAVNWLETEAPENATLEVYRRDFQDAAVPFDMRVNHLYGSEDDDETVDPCPEYIQLGYRDMLHAAQGTYFRNNANWAQYFQDLLAGEFNYEVVATFGPEPRGEGYVPNRPTPGSLTDLLRLGIVPQTDQYADEQELAANQFTVILERTDACTDPRQHPF